MACQDGAGAGAGEYRSQQVTELREQILHLAGHACNEKEEKSRTELLEKLNVCKRDILIELCRSFDIIGSRANRKEELVSFLMKFIEEHSSGIDGTNPDKKIKKRRRVKDEENVSNGKPFKKKMREGTALETQGGEEANGRKSVEDRTNYSECDMKDNRYICGDDKKGKFQNEEVNLDPSERINVSASENVDAITLSEVPVRTNEHALTTSPSAKVVTAAEVDSTNVEASKKKKSSINKKKTTPKEDHKVRSCGKQGSRGDIKPRKQATKPSRDELREAVFLILETANFATMTFGDVVKQVDKYFGKDLFERKPLIRSLIEEELFRLSEEAEKKELEEEEATEAKARAEQAAKEMAQVQVVESGIDKRNELQAGHDDKPKDSAKKANGNTNEKGVRGGASLESADNRNSGAASVQRSTNGIADAYTKNGEGVDDSTMDDKGEKAAPNVNSDDAVQGSRNGKAEIVKNNNVDTLEGSEDDKMKEASNGENDDIEDGRTEQNINGNGGNNAEDVNGCEAKQSNSNGNDERAERPEEGKAQEPNNDEKSANVVISRDKDGKEKEGDTNTEQSPIDAGSNGKAEEGEHNTSTKVDVDSGKNGTAKDGKTDGDVKS